MRWLWWILLTLVRCAWDPEDHEIFEITDAITQVDSRANFYTMLQVDPTANDKEITKAYRKQSLSLHPDKNPSEEAAVLYKQLTSIAKILKDSEWRARYDNHLKRGFPKWKGSAYVYEQYQPGILTVLFVILCFISVTQYITAWIFYYQANKAYLEKKEAANNKTFTQIKKQLKKQKDSPKLTKKAFKQASAADFMDLEVPSAPLLWDVALIAWPTRLVKWIIRREKQD